mmetsp:Transcript_34975/g.105426  ORF Transcript_34975/g.105426 Transcript_34975/m.105426 type:complete len:2113 (+) Transcript_34975:182-6520(+)
MGRHRSLLWWGGRGLVMAAVMCGPGAAGAVVCGHNGTGFSLGGAAGVCFCPVPAVCTGGGPGQCGQTAVPSGALPDSAPSVLPSFSAAGCPACGCAAAPMIYHVWQPSSWTVWHTGTVGVVEWEAAPTAPAITARLVATLANNSVVTVATMATAVAATAGRLTWPVPTSIAAGGQYQVVLIGGGGATVAASPPFNITAGFTPVPRASTAAPCPTAATTVGAVAGGGNCSADQLRCMWTPPLLWPAGAGCAACGRESYQAAGWGPTSGCNPCCAPCPAGYLTPANGSVGLDSCSIRAGNVLANFERVQGAALREAGWYLRTVDTPVTATSCARACLLDHSCKSFDFEPCGGSTAGNGRCRLAREAYSSGLPGMLLRAPGVDHYHLLNASSALGAFAPRGAAFPVNGSVIVRASDTSTEGCAALCAADTTCNSFVSGKAARLGRCVLFSDANGTVAVVGGAAGQLAAFLMYVRPSETPCPAGTISQTGHTPGCIGCPTGSYAGIGSTQCTTCPVGQTTRAAGAVNASACVAASCPVGSDGPDAANDCRCEIGATCLGSAECASNATSGRHYFNIFCSGCSCSRRIDPPTINSVDAPHTGDTLHIGETTSIDFQASNSVQFVYIRLFRMHDTLVNTVTYVGWIGVFSAASGSASWVVPDVPERDDYVILVNHYPYPPGTPTAPTHRNTGTFTIQHANRSCAAGTYNSTAGAAPCDECPLGTYWLNATTCARCPGGTTTADTASLSLADCAINASHPLYAFDIFPHHYLRGSVIPSGYYLEDIDHKSIAECAQLCLDDGGCKSFMAGVPDQHQAGDCFLAYDDRNTTWPGAYQSISQLNFYERKNEGVDVAAELFDADAGCYLVEHDDGGLHENSYTPETCAQMCLNDVCCESFDAGDVTSANIGHCFLSYTSKEREPNSFVCDSSRRLNYFDLTPAVQVSFGPDVLSVVQSSRAGFEAAVRSATQSGLLVPPNVSVHLTSDNRIVATMLTSSRTDAGRVEDLVVGGMLSFTYPSLVGRHYAATFSQSEGPCELGTVSQTGQKPCNTCRNGTYANKAKTVCQECPPGTSSPPGSHMVTQCTVPSEGTLQLINLHDEFVGRYFEPSTGGGSLTLRVANVSGNAVEMIATVHHGGHCDPAQDCRTEGRSEYYLVGTVLNDSILDLDTVAGHYGWVGITDRGFARAPLFGQIQIVNNSTLYRGSWGTNGGVFTTARRCTVSAENVTAMRAGDAYSGYFECETAADNTNPRDVLATELTIEQIAPDGRVTALVSVLTANGTYEYSVEGDYDSDARCSGLQLTPAGADGTANPAWRTTHPTGLVARQWSGHISEDGEHFVGTVNTNPNCACIDSSPYSTAAATIGDFCGRISETECWVASSCPEAVESPDHPGWYYASRGPFTSCSTFRLARVCNVPPELCAAGWTQFSQRCYKVFDVPTTFAGAAGTCASQGADVVSIHSAAEGAFVASMVVQGASNVRNVTLDSVNRTAWIGLTVGGSGAYGWTDNSLYLYTAWAPGFPNTTASETLGSTGVAAADDFSEWIEVNANATLPFACKKGLLAVDTSCPCSGVSDRRGQGDSCMFWGAASVPWCYTTPHCLNASLNADSDLWQMSCSHGEALFNYRALVSQLHLFGGNPHTGFGCPLGYFFNSTSVSCGRCLAQSDCASGTVLSGTCSQSGLFPTCVAQTAQPTHAPTAQPAVAPTTASSVSIISGGSASSQNGTSKSGSTDRHIVTLYAMVVVIVLLLLALAKYVIRQQQKKKNVIHVMNAVQPPDFHNDDIDAQPSGTTETSFDGDGDYAELPAPDPNYTDVSPAAFRFPMSAEPTYFDPTMGNGDRDDATLGYAAVSPDSPLYATVRPRQRTLMIDTDDSADQRKSVPVRVPRGAWGTSTGRESKSPPQRAPTLEEEVYEAELQLERMRTQLYEQSMVPPAYSESEAAGDGSTAAAAAPTPPDNLSSLQRQLDKQREALSVAGARPLPHRSTLQRQLDKQREALDAVLPSRQMIAGADAAPAGHCDMETSPTRVRRRSSTRSTSSPRLPGMADTSDDEPTDEYIEVGPPSRPGMAWQLEKETAALDVYRQQRGRPALDLPHETPTNGASSSDKPPDYNFDPSDVELSDA